MPLELECNYDAALPIEVDGVMPETLIEASLHQIKATKIWLGRDQVELGELFSVSGSFREDLTFVWQGNLKSVHSIGAGMTTGCNLIESSAGRHVGNRMQDGTIIARGSVSDYLGAEMTGGQVIIEGDAGDLVGGNYPGSKFGMNRGTILIRGNAGRGVGQAMRRGTISVSGDCGRLCGWNMLAGTLVVFGNCGANYGAGMKRGTIILAGQPDSLPLPSFMPGGPYQGYLFSVLGSWLRENGVEQAESLQTRCFQMYHGDTLRGGRGELFLLR